MEHIKNALNRFIKKTNLGERSQESFIFDNWTKIVGKNIGNSSTPIKISGSKLFIYADNSGIMNELVYEKAVIKTKVNEVFRENRIKDVVIRIRQ